MRRNVGGADRWARVVVGIVLAVLSVAIVAFGDGLEPLVQLAGAALIIFVGAFLLATAGTEKCPVNGLLGRDTYRGRSRL